MEIDPTTLDGRTAYKTLIGCVVPRPIGWASTVDAEGRPNLAPFSFFGAVTTSPMTLMLSVGRRAGVRKDTAANLLATGEAVLHIADRDLAAAMVATSADLPPEGDEFEHAGLTKAASSAVRPPRVAEAKVAMECVLREHMEVGNGPVDLFLLEVLRLHVDEAVCIDGIPDAGKLRAVGRLGGSGYADTADVFEIPRT